jgi:hypothetical protein
MVYRTRPTEPSAALVWLSLDCQSELDCVPLDLSRLGGGERKGAKRDLDSLQRACKPEWHLRVILVDDRRTRVLANVETLVE